MTSFASSLARRNFCGSARQFAHDVGIPFPDIRDGTDLAVASLAALAEVNPDQLAWSAFRRTEGRNFTLGDQQLTAPALRRHATVVCPCCLVQDVETGRFGNELDMYQRSAWEVAHIRTCLVHSVPLLHLQMPVNNHYTFDFMVLVGDRLDQFGIAAKKAVQRKGTDYELYLLQRLTGVHTMKVGWLDTIPFWLAAKVCEVIGAVIIFGRTPNLKALTEDDWARSGSAGFDLLRHGVTALEDFLRHLQISSEFSGGAGPQKWYGRFYQWLASSETEFNLEPVRSVVRSHIVATAPVEAGALVLGEVVAERRVHSVFSASRAFGLHTRTVRKILTAASLIPANSEAIADNQLTFSAQAATPLLSDLASGIPQKDIIDYLSMTRTQVTTLKALLPRPILEHPSIEPLFRKQDLDAFIVRLLDSAVPVDGGPDMEPPEQVIVSIATAASRSNCQVQEVVQLILDRRLAWVGRDVSLKGFASVLVDLEEVKLLVRLPPLDGKSTRAFADAFGITDRAATQLLAAGLIKGTTAINPINRCPVTIVTSADERNLREELVSLRDLARDSGTNSRRLRRELGERNILPAPDWMEYGAFVYRRERLLQE